MCTNAKTYPENQVKRSEYARLDLAWGYAAVQISQQKVSLQAVQICVTEERNRAAKTQKKTKNDLGTLYIPY